MAMGEPSLWKGADPRIRTHSVRRIIPAFGGSFGGVFAEVLGSRRPASGIRAYRAGGGLSCSDSADHGGVISGPLAASGRDEWSLLLVYPRHCELGTETA